MKFTYAIGNNIVGLWANLKHVNLPNKITWSLLYTTVFDSCTYAITSVFNRCPGAWVRQGPSASHDLQVMRFTKVPLGRSPEPMCWVP